MATMPQQAVTIANKYYKAILTIAGVATAVGEINGAVTYEFRIWLWLALLFASTLIWTSTHKTTRSFGLEQDSIISENPERRFWFITTLTIFVGFAIDVSCNTLFRPYPLELSVSDETGIYVSKCPGWFNKYTLKSFDDLKNFKTPAQQKQFDASLTKMTTSVTAVWPPWDLRAGDRLNALKLTALYDPNILAANESFWINCTMRKNYESVVIKDVIVTITQFRAIPPPKAAAAAPSGTPVSTPIIVIPVSPPPSADPHPEFHAKWYLYDADKQSVKPFGVLLPHIESSALCQFIICILPTEFGVYQYSVKLKVQSGVGRPVEIPVLKEDKVFICNYKPVKQCLFFDENGKPNQNLKEYLENPPLPIHSPGQSGPETNEEPKPAAKEEPKPAAKDDKPPAATK